MKVIIPIAGPDFFNNGSCKGLFPTNSGPLLLSTITSRIWFKSITQLTFVILDLPEARSFSDNYLKKWFPKSKVVFLPNATAGAALSVLAGLAIQSDIKNEPVIIDLADIKFTNNFIPYKEKDDSAFVFTFKSNKKVYSYFALDEEGKVNKAREKEVISNIASAGVYCFPNCSCLIKAIAFALENPKILTHNQLFYITPLFNFLINEGIKIKLKQVNNVVDIKDLYF